MQTSESRWDRSLESTFPDWCEKVAAALGGQARPRNPECATYQYVRLADGPSFWLHLNGYDGRVSVNGDWPSDASHQKVTPRDAINYNTEAIEIHVGAERDPAAAAKDITRRFLPTYREQHAACVAKANERNKYKRQVRENAERIAKTLGISLSENSSSRNGSGDEFHLYPHRDGLYQVRVSSEVHFELRLPVEKAERILKLLNEI